MLKTLHDNFIETIGIAFKAYEANFIDLEKRRDDTAIEIATLSKLASKVSEDIKNAEKEASIRKDIIAKREAEATKKLEDANAMLIKAEEFKSEVADEVKSLQDQKISLESDISSMKMLHNEFKLLSDQKEIKQSELTSLDAKIDKAKDRLKETEDKIESELESVNVLIRNKLKELADIESAIALKKPYIDEKLSFIDRKEKELSDKEKGLSIIEDRYKKLYEAKGAGFKI